jgi:hypothetical protein
MNMKGEKNMQDDLDVLLAKRYVPEMRSHLAERIIAAAQPRAVREILQGRSIFEVFQELFMIPRPAFALSAILLVGLSVGFSANGLSATYEKATPLDLSAFIEVDDGSDAGEWL